MTQKNCPAVNPESIENLFSAWDEPQDITQRWECPDYTWQSSPSRLTNILTRVITQYLSDPNNFPNDELRDMLSAQTPIVTQMTHIDEKEAGQLPKVAVQFAGSKLEERRFGWDNRIEYNIHNSTGTFYTAWHIQHKIEIVARTKREALLLGEAICQLMNHYRTVLMKMLVAHDFKVTQFQGAQVLGEDAANGFMTSLGLLTIAPDKWYLAETAPRLKRINYNLQEN